MFYQTSSLNLIQPFLIKNHSSQLIPFTHLHNHHSYHIKTKYYQNLLLAQDPSDKLKSSMATNSLILSHTQEFSIKKTKNIKIDMKKFNLNQLHLWAPQGGFKTIKKQIQVQEHINFLKYSNLSQQKIKNYIQLCIVHSKIGRQNRKKEQDWAMKSKKTMYFFTISKIKLRTIMNCNKKSRKKENNKNKNYSN